MQLQQLRHIELGRLQDLRLVDVDVLKGVDAPCSLLDLTADRFRDELLDELLQVAAGRFPGHDLEHLFPDLPDLASLGIGCLADLRWPPLCEAYCEETKEIAVGGFDINMCLDESLPFAHKRPELVRSEVHAMEVCEAILALDFINPQLDLTERVILILVQVAQRNFNNTSL